MMEVMKPSKLLWSSAVGIFGLTLGLSVWFGYAPAARSTWTKSSPADRPPAGSQSGSGHGDDGVADDDDDGIGRGSTLVVDYRDDVTDADLAATPEVEIPVSRWSARDRLYRVTFGSEAEARQARGRLRRDARVESVDFDAQASIPADEVTQEAAAPGDRSMQAECATTARSGTDDASGSHQGFPSDPCYRYQWHLRQAGLPAAWKLGQGEGAVVAVIDTGVSRVPDLAGTRFVPGYNFVADTDDASDDHGHGTHVAGTIAQSTNNQLGVGGVAFGAAIMPLKVLSARGSGSMAAIAQAIRFAADNGANVINMSLGGPFPIGTIAKAVKYARDKGVTVVAAAGNDGRGRVSYPARYPGVIAVAATQFDETTTFYSNWGPEIDIAAPGGNVRVDQNGDGKPDGVLQNTVVPGNTSTTDYLWFMGTSMATPHVAGVAALIVGAGVKEPAAVEKILLGSARQPKPTGGVAPGTALGSPAGDGGAAHNPHYGAGLLDADAALRNLRGRRGASELGLGASLALLGLGWLSRRGRLDRGLLGAGFGLAVVLGSSGLFGLPWLGLGHAGLPGLLMSGVLADADAAAPGALQSNPLLWSALLPLAAIALFNGVRGARGILAGLAFGVGGALLFAAIGKPFSLAWVPGLLERPWLVANAFGATWLGTAVLRRG
jgi:serine protease